MNPELQRNIWLELTPYRLMAMPVILAGVFLLASLVAGPNVGRDMALAACVVFAVIAFPWGNRSVAESLTREIAANTWDQQRMSALGAWTMTWGKLVGGAIHVWYGCAFCLVVFTISLAGSRPAGDLALAVALMIMTAVFSHAVCFLFSLLAVQRRRPFGTARTGLYQFVALVVSVPVLYAGLADLASGPGSRDILWFGLVVGKSAFLLLTMSCGAAWAIAGATAVMRTEFQQLNPPWLWLGFAGFAMVYVGGIDLIPDMIAGRIPWLPAGLFPAFCLAMAITYVTAFSEPKSLVKFRRLTQSVGTGGFLARLSRSVFGLALVGLSVAAILFVDASGPASPAIDDQEKLRLLTVVIFLFVVRDIAIIHLFSLLSPKSGERRAFLSLVLVYSAVPALVSVMSLDPLLPLFWPLWGVDAATGLAAVAVQAALFVGYLFWVCRTSAARATREAGGEADGDVGGELR